MGELGVYRVAGLFLTTNMDYSKDYIRELMKWVDPYSILIINSNCQLVRLYCPFSVVVKIPVGNLQIDDVVTVEAVKITLELKDVYIINGKAFYVIHFRILI
jgi:hypothetical protein